MSNKLNLSMALVSPDATSITGIQKLALGIGFGGLFVFVLALFNTPISNNGWALLTAFVFIAVGTIIYARQAYLTKPEGIKNDGTYFKSMSSKGLWGWILGVVLTLFYIVLYFFPQYLGLGMNGKPNRGLIALFDPLSQLLSGRTASQWFVYGTLYTLAILIFGYKFILKYRHNRYQKIRTFSVMFFQLGFAFLIPEFMYVLNSDLPYYDLKNMWPLNYYIFDEWSVNGFLSAGQIGMILIIFGIFSVFVISPMLTYKFGKRWYCSWVCGCGGLAETAGDTFRQLSSKKMSAWHIERWLIHAVLVFSVVMTVAMVSTYLGYDRNTFWLTKQTFILISGLFLTGLYAAVMYFKRNAFSKKVTISATISYLIVIAFFTVMLLADISQIKINAAYFSFGINTNSYPLDGALRTFYGFAIGSIFSGVIGTGFYPILGNRAWCRFGCPMAAILGFQQRLFSKFRITTNGGQCISCGNCSTYCEMGIDVRAYAQKGENIVRSSCVGCGICSAVCPRGVLKLENATMQGRIQPNEILLGNDVDLMKLVNEK